MNKRSNKTHHRTRYLNNFSRLLEVGKFGEAAILAIKEKYCPEAVRLSGYGKLDLRLGNIMITVKVRHIRKKYEPSFYVENNYRLVELLKLKYSVEFFLIRYGIMKCIIERYSVEII